MQQCTKCLKRTGRVNCLRGILRVLRIKLAGDVELEDDCVLVGGLGLLVVREGLELARVHAQRHEAKAVGQYLILNDRRVVPDVYVLDGHGGHLGQQDAAQRVGDGSVHADEVEHDLFIRQALDFDLHLALGLLHEAVAALALHIGLLGNSHGSVSCTGHETQIDGCHDGCSPGAARPGPRG
jgi:hypothetical protein